MPAHPTRRRNRTRGTALASEPVAFRRTPDAHRIDQRDRMRPLAGTLGFDARTPEETERFGTFYNATLEARHPMRADFPGRDALGRRNPRMARRAHA